MTAILGYPGHLLALPDGRILCVYGYRFGPYAIRAVVSEDQGRTWDVAGGFVVRGGLPNADLGYPASLVLNGGGDQVWVFTVYYAQDDEDVTCIQATRYRL